MRTPPLDTPRLTLRPYRESGLEGFVALNTDPEVRRHAGGPLTPTEATGRFQSLHGGSQGDACAVTLRGAGQYIGHSWLVMRDDPEIGFLLVRSVWRQGYGTEVAVTPITWESTAASPAAVLFRHFCSHNDRHKLAFLSLSE